MSTEKRSDYIDTHVHVWSSDLKKYGLGKGFTPENMKPRAYLPEQILRDAAPSGVNRVVLVQIIFYGFDNSFMLDSIRQRPENFRGVAVIDAEMEAPEMEMLRLAELGVRGFRFHPEEIDSPKFGEGGFAKMFRCAADKRFAICLLTNPGSLPAIEQQCRKFPDTPFVIDHLARIGVGNVIREQDVNALCALARYPEVRVKVSAFYALGQAKPPHMDLAPLVKRVYEAFGPQRLMWGSDCPYHLCGENYDQGISPIRDGFDFLSSEDRTWLLSRTAENLFFK